MISPQGGPSCPHRRRARRRLLGAATGLVVIAALFPISESGATAQSRGRNKPSEEQVKDAFRRESIRVRDKYSAALDKLAASGAKKGLIKEGRDLYKEIRRLNPDYERLAELRRELTDVEKPSEDKDLEPARDRFRSDLERARAAHAKALFRFAEGGFRYGLYTRAFQLLHEILETSDDPTNSAVKNARAALGYAWDSKEKSWRRKWELQLRRKHYLTDEGWVEKKHKKKWDEGLRPWREKDWVPKDVERERRNRNDYNPYRVTSEFFAVSTKKGRAEAWKFAQILDSFKREFLRVFLGYYEQKKSGKLLFQLGKADLHPVYVFKDRYDYLQHVREKHGNKQLLRESAGFYSPRDRVSRFFFTEDQERTYATLFHEVAHQLFEETKDDTGGGSVANNWVIEGLAVYVETWARSGDKWYPGRKTDIPELTMARGILKEGSFDLEEFVTVDNKSFHETGRTANYALSGALVHFFMHYDEEVYKEDFLRFVSDFYGGRIRDKYALADYIPAKGEGPIDRFSTIADEFREYMRNLRAKKSKSKRSRKR